METNLLLQLMYLETDYRPLFRNEFNEGQKKIIDMLTDKRHANIEVIFTQHNPFSKEQKLVELSDYFKKF